METVEKHSKRQAPRTDTEGKERMFAHCQWLFGEGRDREFCRNPTEPRQMWCLEHMKAVYVPASKRQKAEEMLEKKMIDQETTE